MVFLLFAHGTNKAVSCLHHPFIPCAFPAKVWRTFVFYHGFSQSSKSNNFGELTFCSIDLR